jgi:hypothetical protein
MPNPEPQDRRPDLHLVTDDDINAAAAAEGVEPLPPWQDRVTALVSRLPAVFTERPASFAERVEHSRTGDWATAEEDWKRTAHLLATLLAMVPGLVGALLLAVTARPGRVLLLAVALWLLAHIV